MKNILDSLREKNPALKLYSVMEAEFAPYGCVLEGYDCAGLAAALAATPIPQQGNSYLASCGELEALPVVDEIGRLVFGAMPVQAGYCNGHGFTLNAEEYHKCSEVNFCTGEGAVLFLARPDDVKERELDSADVLAFYLPAGVLVEIYPRVLHFAPCRVNEEGFRCLVVLEKGTNSALDSVDSSAPGEAGMLWMKNKWMLCHPQSPQAEKGAFIGIRGDNLQLEI